jgi:hypothetical protein
MHQRPLLAYEDAADVSDRAPILTGSYVLRLAASRTLRVRPHVEIGPHPWGTKLSRQAAIRSPVVSNAPMICGSKLSPATTKTIDTLSKYDIVRDGEVHDLDVAACHVTEVAIDNVANLVGARNHSVRLRFPYRFACEVAHDLIEVEAIHASNSPRTTSSGLNTRLPAVVSGSHRLPSLA